MRGTPDPGGPSPDGTRDLRQQVRGRPAHADLNWANMTGWSSPEGTPTGQTDLELTPTVGDNGAVEPTSRVIVALDFDNRRAADEIVDRLGDECRFYKVGLELLTAAGPDLVKHLVAHGKDVFLDLKLFEIPNSVAGAVRAAGALGVSMVTVHSMGGSGIMGAAVAAARDFPQLRVLALTVVTSMTNSDLADVGVHDSTEAQVLRLARLAQHAGCHGVIASPQEAGPLREVMGPRTLIVTPGVTLPGESPTEHARPGTPRAAVAAGASHVVVGRAVTRAADPVAALRLVRANLGL